MPRGDSFVLVESAFLAATKGKRSNDDPYLRYDNFVQYPGLPLRFSTPRKSESPSRAENSALAR
jgi:hypothetical protein